MQRTARSVLVLLVALVCAGAAPAAAHAPSAAPADAEVRIETAEQWVWPVSQDVRIVRPFEAPPHRYGPGHRGIDLAADAAPLRAPASGVIAFAGVVVDRPLLTIDHGDGLVTTLEPATTELAVGDAVSRGQEIGALASGGHAAPGAVHFGVRLHGEYINPLLLLGGVPRAVLLPCC
ncbi:murein hydrolase activator EnvC family protein [Microbacterium barkeri]|nr:M23 family metallopeptidase [Microbacterium barkeri]MDR6875892.1 murein DD-endopeptidase MepM/ murein hydrolase activator NlpD [Microbacterium barkeri]